MRALSTAHTCAVSARLSVAITAGVDDRSSMTRSRLSSFWMPLVSDDFVPSLRRSVSTRLPRASTTTAIPATASSATTAITTRGARVAASASARNAAWIAGAPGCERGFVRLRSASTTHAGTTVNVVSQQPRMPMPPIHPNWWKLSTSPAASTPNEIAVASAAMPVARSVCAHASSSAASNPCSAPALPVAVEEDDAVVDAGARR